MDQQVFLQRLNQVGVDIDKAVARFMGNKALFISFIRRLPESLRFEEMRAQLKAQDQEGFYVNVHNLKGAAGNLGVQSIYECAEAILIELRTSGLVHERKLNDLLSEAQNESEQLSELLRAYEAQKEGTQ